MCGIGGIIYNENFNSDSKKIIEKIDIMKSHQNRRGPDFSNVYINDNIFLFHNRLSIVDLSENGNQPMSYKNFTIIFNGEIYNAFDLKEKYLKNNIFNGNSDTEILLHLLVNYGIDFTLQEINGMFAFCLVDNNSKDVYLIRDRIGQKPLYYFLHNKNLYFSSNPSSIVLALPEYDWELNYEAVWEFFVMGGIFSENTLFKNIKRLNSSTILKYNKGIKEIKEYWSPNYIEKVSDEYIENLIIDSVEKVKISDVPMSIFLSGGIDSTLVSSILKDINAVHLSSDEIQYAKIVSEKLKIKLDIIEPSSFDIMNILEDYSYFSGEPTMSGFIPYVTSKYTSNNYKVAISANGADELFFGYNRIPTPNTNNSLFSFLMNRSNLSINQYSLDEKNHLFNIFRNPKNFTIKNFEHRNKESDVLNLIEKNLKKLDEKFPKSSYYRWLELMTYVKGDLNCTLDFASMANSLEVRCPFLDHRLIETCLSVDDSFHIDKIYGRKKYLKKMLNNYGYNFNFWEREKKGFSLKKSYLVKIEELKDFALNNLKKDNILNLNINNNSRDAQYLKSAALGFYCWKKKWIDSGIIKK